jgi:hypothetical protein
MEGLIASILLPIAKRAGARAVEHYLGKGAAELTEEIVDTIAKAAGAKPEDLPSMPEKRLEDAVLKVEPLTPAIVTAWVEQQREANRLMMAEMEKESAWSWAWRPATMWLIAAFWLWSLVLVPIANALAGAQIPVFLQELTWFTTAYMALYMSGHTAKEVFARRSERNG